MWMPERLKVWQVLFLLFPLLVWLAYSSYVDFTRLEEEGGVLYVGRTTKLLFEIGGKWAVVGFPIVIAGVWGYAVYKTIALSKQADALAARAEQPPAPVAAPTGQRPSEPLVVAASSQPPAASRPPAARAASSSGPITPLAASPPPAPARAAAAGDDVPPDPAGPRFLR